jgi:hypothetical protein
VAHSFHYLHAVELKSLSDLRIREAALAPNHRTF